MKKPLLALVALVLSTTMLSGCSPSSEPVGAPDPVIEPIETPPEVEAPVEPPIVETPLAIVEAPPAPAPVVEAPPAPPEPAPAPVVEPPAPAPAAPVVTYANCDEVKAAGAAPLSSGQPGYQKKLDRDGDGIACDK